MATIIGSTNNSLWTYKLEVLEDSYSIENNTSNVTVRMYIGRASSRSYIGGGWTGSITVDGYTHNVSGTIPYPTYIDGGAWYEVASTTYSGVGHNADGTKTIPVSGTMSSSVFTPSYCSASGSVSLTTIPRASSISSVTTANIGSNATINVDRKSSSFTHTITYSFESLSGTIVTKSSNTSISWAIPTSFYGQIPNSKTGNGTLTITTYNGNTQIGSSSTKSFSVTTSESACKPTVTGSVIDSNSTTTTITGNNKILIAGYSTASVSCSSSPKNSSSIKSISVNSKYAYTGTSYTEVSRTKELENFNSNTIVIKAKDSRGYENTKTLNSGSDYTLINYIPLTFNGTVSRQTPTGSVLLLSFSGNYFSSNLGNTSNSLNISWKYREKSEENWVNGRTLIEGTDYTINSSNNTYSSGNSSFQSTISLGNNFDYQKAYEIAVFYNDVLVSASVVIQGLKGKPIINWGEDFFNVNGEIRQNNIPISAGGGSSITTTVDVGTTTTGASGTQAKVTNSGNSVNAVFDFVIPRGEKGDKGDPGSGIISGGATGQVLAKKSNTNYDTEWITPVITETDPVFSASAASGITSNDISNWNSKSNFNGDYNSLTNKPNIPAKVSDLTNDSGFITSYTETDPLFSNSPASNITNNDINNWNSKTSFSGDYNDLTNKPSIPTVPTNLSSFIDDLGSSPVHTHSQYLTSHQDISGKVDKVAGKGLSTNDFTNTYKDNVDSNTIARHTHNNKDLLDSISSTDITNWNNKSDFSGSYNDLTDKPTIPTVPTNISAFTNDSGYLTEHQSLEGYATTQYVNASIAASIPTEIIQYYSTDEEKITKLNSCMDYDNAELLKKPILLAPFGSGKQVYGELISVNYRTKSWTFKYCIPNAYNIAAQTDTTNLFPQAVKTIQYRINDNTLEKIEDYSDEIKQRILYSDSNIKKILCEEFIINGSLSYPTNILLFEFDNINISFIQWHYYRLDISQNDSVISYIFNFISGNNTRTMTMSINDDGNVDATDYNNWTLTIDGVVV